MRYKCLLRLDPAFFCSLLAKMESRNQHSYTTPGQLVEPKFKFVVEKCMFFVNACVVFVLVHICKNTSTGAFHGVRRLHVVFVCCLFACFVCLFVLFVVVFLFVCFLFVVCLLFCLPKSATRFKHIEGSKVHWTGKQETQISNLNFHLTIRRFSPFNCCLFKGITPKICRLCFCPNK